MKKILRKIINIIKSIKSFIGYHIHLIYYQMISDRDYKILSDLETVDRILNERISISRYGDGEFKWLLNIKQRNFQDDSIELSNRLKEVLVAENKNLIIGIPSLINSTAGITYSAKKYWMDFLAKNYKELKKYLSKNKIYCDSYITRPYIDRKQKDEYSTTQRYNNLKRIWDKKSIIIVEGKYSRLGVGNDLFQNANCVKRIICPSQNAFNKYNEIYNSILKQNKDNIIILSLGPTATILANDLSKVGYQALDLGHIDIEYMWFKNKSLKKEKIYGRYVNEIPEYDDPVEEITNQKYYDEIIDTIEL